MGTTAAGVVLALISLAVGAGGYGLVLEARSRPEPAEPAHRRVPGIVVSSGATRCGTASRPRGTCFQPVVAYEDAGQPRQFRARTRYDPVQYVEGDAVTVVVAADGPWLDREWRDAHARRLRQHADARRFPLVMGWLLGGCAVCGLLLAFGLIFWVDRSGEAPPG
jgi:hypothetical protein